MYPLNYTYTNTTKIDLLLESIGKDRNSFSDTQRAAKAQGCHHSRLCKACSTSLSGVKRLILSVFCPLGKACFYSEGCLLQWELTLSAWLTITKHWFIETCGRPAERRNGFSLCDSNPVFISFLVCVTAYPTSSPTPWMVRFPLLPVIFYISSIASYLDVPCRLLY